MTKAERAVRDHAVAAALKDVETEPRVSAARKRYELAKAVTAIATTLLVTASFALLLWLSASANATANAIRDCTQPGGQCYRDAERRTGLIIHEIDASNSRWQTQGSVPAQASLEQTRTNGRNISIILGILDREYPEAAKAVRAELKDQAP